MNFCFHLFEGTQVQFPIYVSGLADYPNKIVVFGIPMFATSGWSAQKLNHVASIMAELLDQDEDGCADDQRVLNALTTVENNLRNSVILPTDIDDDDNLAYARIEAAGYYEGQRLGETETKPECTGIHFTHDCSDASIEELFHFITTLGHATTYPTVFGTSLADNSMLTKAMDIARGGHFKNIPNKYPNFAWYTYDDKTCDYGCQAAEYIWWGYCAFSGVCGGRSGSRSYENEFKYLAKSQFISRDLKLSKLFQDSGSFYKLPTKPVDGKYHGLQTCPGYSNHGGYSAFANVGK